MLTAEQVQVTRDGARLPDGRMLAARPLSFFARDFDNDMLHRGIVAQWRVQRAIADNFVLCLLPDGDAPGKFGVSRGEAQDVAYRDADRVIAVAPYYETEPEMGEAIVCDGTDLRGFWAEGLYNQRRAS